MAKAMLKYLTKKLLFIGFGRDCIGAFAYGKERGGKQPITHGIGVQIPHCLGTEETAQGHIRQVAPGI